MRLSVKVRASADNPRALNFRWGSIKPGVVKTWSLTDLEIRSLDYFVRKNQLAIVSAIPVGDESSVSGSEPKSKPTSAVAVEQSKAYDDIDKMSYSDLKDLYKEVFGKSPGNKKKKVLLSELKGERT